MIKRYKTLLLVCACVLIGCNRDSQSNVKPATKSKPIVSTKTETPAAVPDLESNPSESEPELATLPETKAAEDSVENPSVTDNSNAVADIASAMNANTNAASVQEVAEAVTQQEPTAPEVPVEPPVEPPPASRLLLPTTAGPLLVDVEVDIDGQNLFTAFEQRIAKAIKDARGEDDELSWQQFFQFVSTNPDMFGRNSATNRKQYRSMRERYDENRNNAPDVKEVAKFLFRNNGIHSPLRLMGTNHYRDSNRAESQVFRALDQNEDKVLSLEEIQMADVQLHRIDPNSDQRIDLSELADSAPNRVAMMNMDSAWNRRKINRRGEVAMDFDGYIDWTMTSYAMDDWFGNPGPWSDQSFADQLDRNSNGTIEKDEAKTVTECEVDIRLKASFGQTTSIAVQSVSPAIQGVTQSARDDQVVFRSNRLNLVFYITNQTSQNSQQVPPEAFAMLDANNDGLLDESEIPEQAPEEFSIKELDKNNDEKLSLEEINQRNNKDKELPVWASQIRGRGAEIPDAVFSWLDQNQDHSLSSREIQQTPARLLDCTVDGQPLTSGQIPDTFVVHLLRGDPAVDQQNFRALPKPVVANNEMPTWAVHMDSNRDGEVSHVEFVGTDSAFEKLDSNGDQFLDSTECDAAK